MKFLTHSKGLINWGRNILGFYPKLLMLNDLIYVPIPKNGNSYYTSLFLQNDSKSIDYDADQETALSYFQRGGGKNIRINNYYYNFRSNETFVVIRNPVARFVSAYIDKIIKVDPNPTFFNLVSYYLGRKVTLESLDFASFVEFCECVPIYRFDSHIRPQSEYIPKLNSKTLKLFKLENKVEIRQYLSEKGIVFRNPNLTSDILKKTNYFDYSTDFSHAPRSELKALAHYPTLNNMVNSSVRKKICSMYANDFRFYDNAI